MEEGLEYSRQHCNRYHFIIEGVFGDIPPYVDIAVNYGPGDAIWFTSLTKNQVGRYDITGLYK